MHKVTHKKTLAVISSFALGLGLITATTTVSVFTAPSASADSDRDADYLIGFENTGSTDPTRIQTYTSNDGFTLTADPSWLNSANNCNGIIVSAAQAKTNTSDGQTGPTNDYRNATCSKPGGGSGAGQYSSSAGALVALTHALGDFAATRGSATVPAENHALATFTDNSNAGPANVAMAEVVQPYTTKVGHFYTLSIDAAAVNCFANNTNMDPQIVLNLLSQDGSKFNSTPTPIIPCVNPDFVTNQNKYQPDFSTTISVKRVTGTAFLATDANNKVRPQILNANGRTVGNDGAVDNIILKDVTPSITKSFDQTPNTTGDGTTLTFTVKNTAENGAKNGWKFTDNLPAGVKLAATPNVGGTCQNIVPTGATAGATSFVTTGDLPLGATSCTVTVQVTSSSAGTFTNSAANMETGLITSEMTPQTATWTSPTDGNETATTPANTPVELDPFANYAGAPGDPTPPTVDKTTFKFDNGETTKTTTEGTWSYDPATGKVTFTPAKDYVGVTPAMPYTYKDSSGNTVNGNLTVTVEENPAITFDKAHDDPVDANGDGKLSAGDTIAYKFLVTNTGDISVKTVAITDNKVGAVTCPVTTLDPKATTTCSTVNPYVLTQADIDAGKVDNTASVTAASANDTPVNAADTDTAPLAQAPASTITKSHAKAVDVNTNGFVDAGDTVAYTFVVTNTGNATLSNVAVNDPKLTGVTCPAGALAPGASVTCTGANPYVLTAADITAGKVDNTATTTSTGPGGQAVTAEATNTFTLPDVKDVTKTGAQGQSVTQAPSLGETALATTVQFPTTGQPDGAVVSADGKTLTVPGQGVWTASPTTGELTFTPNADFKGNPTPVKYTAADKDGNLAEPATATVTYPDVKDVAKTGVQGQPVSVDPILGEGTLPTTVKFPTDGQPNGAVVSADGKTLTVPGEGAWVVNPTTGAMTFTPEKGFQGDPTPVKYTAADKDGNLAEPATATVTYPDVKDVVKTGAQGQPVTVDPVLDKDADPTTVKFPADGQPTGATVSPDGKTVTVPGEGVWTVDPKTGAMTFTPEKGFQGDPTPVKFTAADKDGNLAEPATVTVTYPDVSDVSGVGAQGQPVTVAPVLEDGTLPTTVKFPAEGQPAGSTVSGDGKTLTVPGQGVWTIDPNTGAMTFTPEKGFQGDPTPVKFTAADKDGNLAEPATVTVTYPDVSDVSGVGAQGKPATVQPALDKDADPTTVKFPAEGQPTGATVSPDGKTVTVPGEGVWTVDPKTGAMTFTPEAGFKGDPTPVKFTAADKDGNLAEPATVTVKYPDVSNVSGTGSQGQPVTIAPILDPEALPTTVQFPSEGQPAGSTVSGDGKKITVPGEGVWTVDPKTGAMTFTPEPGFQGDPTPVKYTAADKDGNLAEPATATVIYPDVNDATAQGSTGQPVTVTPTFAEGIDPSSVELLGKDGNPVKSLTVPGEGEWVVNKDGSVTFTPEAGFIGNPTPVQFTAKDKNGGQAEPATVSVTYPVVPALSVEGNQGEPVKIMPRLSDDIDPTSLGLIGNDGKPVKSLVVPGEGTWTVGNDGSITFTPVDGFQGNPTPVKFSAKDKNGNATPPATITVTYPDVQDASGTGETGKPSTIKPSLRSDLDPNTLTLVDGNGNRVSVLKVPGQGTWSVSPGGIVVFTPEEGFTGSPTPVKFTAADRNGHFATPAELKITYPGGVEPKKVAVTNPPAHIPAIVPTSGFDIPRPGVLSLPKTGANMVGAGLGALALIGCGIVGVAVARRRKQ